MRTQVIEIYEYCELDKDAQERARREVSGKGLQIGEYWYDGICEDAETVGLSITEFNLHRGYSIDMEYMNMPDEVAQSILRNHGTCCDSYELAKSYLDEKSKLGADADPIELETEFLSGLKRYYLKMLRHQLNWLYSDEAVIDFAENHCEFYKDGSLY